MQHVSGGLLHEVHINLLSLYSDIKVYGLDNHIKKEHLQPKQATPVQSFCICMVLNFNI